MRSLLQCLIITLAVHSVWAQEDDDDDKEFGTFLKDDPKVKSDEDGEEPETNDEEEEEEDDKPEEEEDFDEHDPERHEKMFKCYDYTKKFFDKSVIDEHVELLKKEGKITNDEDVEKAKMMIVFDKTSVCYFNVVENQNLWGPSSLMGKPFGALSEDNKKDLFISLFKKADNMPPVSKKQAALMHQIISPPPKKKESTETDDEREARIQRMAERKQRQKEGGGQKEEQKKKKRAASTGPKVDLPLGLLSLGTRGQFLYIFVVVAGIAGLMAAALKLLMNYQESESSHKVKKAKKDGKKKK